MPISKAEQEAEAVARASERGTHIVETVPDTAPELTSPEQDTTVPVTQVSPLDQPVQDTKPISRAKDSKRDEITKRFRQARQEELDSGEESDALQIRKFARDGMPPELVEPDTPPPVQEPELEQPVEQEVSPEDPPAPVKRKLIIRGKEMELTEEELIAAAQKSLAAENYLDEAKQRLQDVAEMQRRIQAQLGGERQPQGQPVHSGPAQSQTQTTEAETTPVEGTEQPGDHFTHIGEKIQFGDPTEVGQVFVQEIDKIAEQKSREALMRERMRNEAVRTQKILREFQGQHPELAQDKFASALMRTRLIELQAEDLKSLGIDEAQLPKDPDTIANWHQYYRTEGHNVRDVPTMLKTARDDFLSWKGVPAQSKPVETPKVTATPKVTLTPARETRKATIQPQPSRTVVPKPDAQTQAQPDQQEARALAVQNMRKMRAMPRNPRAYLNSGQAR